MPSPAAEQEKVTEKQRELKLKLMLSSTLFSSLLATTAALGAVECWHLNTKLPFIDKQPKTVHCIVLVLVVQKVDCTIHWINHIQWIMQLVSLLVIH